MIHLIKPYQSRREYLEAEVDKISKKIERYQNYVLDGVKFRLFGAIRSFGNVSKELERLQKKQFNLESKLFKLDSKKVY